MTEIGHTKTKGQIKKKRERVDDSENYILLTFLGYLYRICDGNANLAI